MNSYKQLQGQTLTSPIGALTKMSDLITSSAVALLIITRMGIPLGFGEKTIKQLCQEHGVDLKTLLLLLNSAVVENYRPSQEQIRSVHLDSLITYLSQSHSYFLDYRLPSIRQRLLSAISDCPQELAYVIRIFSIEMELASHNYIEDEIFTPHISYLEQQFAD